MDYHTNLYKESANPPSPELALHCHYPQWRSLRCRMRILLVNSYLLISSLSRCKFVLGSEHDTCLLRNTVQNYSIILKQTNLMCKKILK